MNRKVSITFLRKIYRKLLPVVVFFAILAFGINLFFKNENWVLSFKPYYLGSYGYVLRVQTAKLARKIKVPVKLWANTSNIQKEAETVPVITYHGIISDQPDGANVSLKQFAYHMISLKEAGWQTVSIEQYYDFIYKGEPLPEKSFLLTFDDGRKDAYYPADPILKALGYRATMFIITDEALRNNSPYYLNKEELLKMKASGRWDIQVHTKNGHALKQIDLLNKGHFYTNKLWLSGEKRMETDEEYYLRVKADLDAAKKDLESELGLTVYAIAMPYGDIAEGETNYPAAKSILNKLIAENYVICFYQFWPGRGYSTNYRNSKSLLNNRIPVKVDFTQERLLTEMEKGTGKPLPYSDNFESDRGWLNPWGLSFYNGHGLLLRPTSRLNSSNTYLDGTLGWRDYELHYTVSASPGTVVKQQARRYDYDNLASCSYSSKGVVIELIRDGAGRIIASKDVSLDLGKGISAGTLIKGNEIGCFVGDKIILKASLNGLRTNGGIGFESWGRAPDNFIEINNLEVRGI